MMNDKERHYDVFLSYRRDGGLETAMLLRNSLELSGYSVFLDVESLRSGPFNEKLYEFIDGCKDFVLILPPNGLNRCASKDDWVRVEIERAHQAGRNIVPVMLKGFDFPAELPESINFIRYQNGLKASFDYYDAFLNKLTSFLLSKPNNPTPPVPRPKAWMIALIVLAAAVALAFFAFHNDSQKDGMTIRTDDGINSGMTSKTENENVNLISESAEKQQLEQTDGSEADIIPAAVSPTPEASEKTSADKGEILTGTAAGVSETASH